MVEKGTARISTYWSLIKSLQTGLLLFTGLAGYMSARCPVITWPTLLALTGSLLFSISGSTVLNMIYDRDIDAIMPRTCNRPLPKGEITLRGALFFGVTLSLIGVGWAFGLNRVYGGVILAGLVFDVFVYTVWLKRRTAWSILFGGVAGGMPVLAGRALGLGSIDIVGIAMALAVLLWIPTHIMTFTLRYEADYRRAQIPTFPGRYGRRRTHLFIALSSISAAFVMALAAYGIGMTWGYLRVLIILSAGLLVLASSSLLKPSRKLNFSLFKYASFYMLSSMALVLLETI
jgi:protoheme IX farnesyltransferase